MYRLFPLIGQNSFSGRSCNADRIALDIVGNAAG